MCWKCIISKNYRMPRLRLTRIMAVYSYCCCCCSSHFIWAELRKGWATREEVGRAWGALGGDQVRGSCIPPSLGVEAAPPPVASPPSQLPRAPLEGAPARRVAGWVWVRPHRCQHTHRSSRDHYWDNLQGRNIVSRYCPACPGVPRVSPVSLWPGLQQLETAPAHSSGARLGAGHSPTSPSPLAPESPKAPAAAS